MVAFLVEAPAVVSRDPAEHRQARVRVAHDVRREPVDIGHEHTAERVTQRIHGAHGGRPDTACGRRSVHAADTGLAGVDRAGEAVVADGGRGPAAGPASADIARGAGITVVARRRVGRGDAAQARGAAVVGAELAVVAGERRAGLAADAGRADLGPVAEIGVLAAQRHASLAASVGVAGGVPGAWVAVVTEPVVGRRLAAHAGHAHIDGAGHAIIAGEREAGRTRTVEAAVRHRAELAVLAGRAIGGGRIAAEARLAVARARRATRTGCGALDGGAGRADACVTRVAGCARVAVFTGGPVVHGRGGRTSAGADVAERRHQAGVLHGGTDDRGRGAAGAGDADAELAGQPRVAGGALIGRRRSGALARRRVARARDGACSSVRTGDRIRAGAHALLTPRAQCARVLVVALGAVLGGGMDAVTRAGVTEALGLAQARRATLNRLRGAHPVEAGRLLAEVVVSALLIGRAAPLLGDVRARARGRVASVAGARVPVVAVDGGRVRVGCALAVDADRHAVTEVGVGTVALAGAAGRIMQAGPGREVTCVDGARVAVVTVDGRVRLAHTGVVHAEDAAVAEVGVSAVGSGVAAVLRRLLLADTRVAEVGRAGLPVVALEGRGAAADRALVETARGRVAGVDGAGDAIVAGHRGTAAAVATTVVDRRDTEVIPCRVTTVGVARAHAALDGGALGAPLAVGLDAAGARAGVVHRLGAHALDTELVVSAGGAVGDHPRVAGAVLVAGVRRTGVAVVAGVRLAAAAAAAVGDGGYALRVPGGGAAVPVRIAYALLEVGRSGTARGVGGIAAHPRTGRLGGVVGADSVDADHVHAAGRAELDGHEHAGQGASVA